jgi:hypothetical protein
MWHAWEGEREFYKVLVGNPERKRPFDRQRHRWEGGIRKDPWKIGGEGGMQWNLLARDRDPWRALVNTVMKLRVLVPQS